MLGFLRRQYGTACDLLSSKLYDEKSFYPALFQRHKELSQRADHRISVYNI